MCIKYDTAAKQDYFLLNGHLHYVVLCDVIYIMSEGAVGIK